MQLVAQNNVGLTAKTAENAVSRAGSGSVPADLQSDGIISAGLAIRLDVCDDTAAR